MEIPLPRKEMGWKEKPQVTRGVQLISTGGGTGCIKNDGETVV